jgi:lambda family phage portal protein
MNIIDKVVSVFSPGAGARRMRDRMRLDIMEKISNTGYSHGGASHTSPALKRWNPSSGSPERDIEENRKTLRERSRDLYMNSPLGAAAINSTRTNVVGGGLIPKPRIDYEYLHISRETAELMETAIKKEFAIWAESTLCDNNDQNNFYELQQIALADWLKNGEEFCLIRYDKDRTYMPYQLRLKLIEGDRVSTPGAIDGDYNAIHKSTVTGNEIINGVEIDKHGKVTAYYISSHFPGNLNWRKKITWTRVEKRGQKTGNPNILHIFNAERADQYRGVPLLAPVIEALKQITRYTEAEITAAVLGAVFSVFVTTENGDDVGEYAGDDEYYDEDDEESEEIQLSTGASVHYLANGEKVNTAQATHPSGTFDAFVSAMAVHVGAALEIAPEVLQKKFAASYSAAKGAMTETWKSFRMRRAWFVRDFCQEVYELWFNEAVSKGRISAPGYFNDPGIKKAYTRCTWTGPAPGALDPGKEVDAAIKRIHAGLSTHEEEAAAINGSDFDDNVRTLEREFTLLENALPDEKREE